jgi:prolyl-tRNA synthetase
VHRVGRAGHGGGTAEAFTFRSPGDLDRWTHVEKAMRVKLVPEAAPAHGAYMRMRDGFAPDREDPLPKMGRGARGAKTSRPARPGAATRPATRRDGASGKATHDEAEEETRRMLGVYREFMEGYMAMPVITGQKTDSEKFAGALRTYACEAMMQDNKALQAGTSHNLGQNFAKAFDLSFQNEQGEQAFAWNTSWGVSTRMIGGLVMTHGDDAGLRLPPKLTPIQMVIVPIWKTEEERTATVEMAKRIAEDLGSFKRPDHERIRVHVDDRVGVKPGAKYYHWELRGIPLRMEIGPRDLASNTGMLARRDTREKRPISFDTLRTELPAVLDTIQADMLAAARARVEANTIRERISYGRFKEVMDGPGAFVYAGWNGDPAVEQQVKEETKATIRVIPDL